MPGTTPKPSARQPEPQTGFVAVGLVRAARGVRGELSVDPLTEFPQRFRPGSVIFARGAPYTVRRARSHRGALLLELEGIASREQADALRGALLEVPQKELSPLAEGQYYRFDIVGMAVVDHEGAPLGRIEEIVETGANDVYLVRNDDGDLLVPAIDTVIKEVDVAGRRMVVELVAGLERKPHPRRRRR